MQSQKFCLISHYVSMSSLECGHQSPKVTSTLLSQEVSLTLPTSSLSLPHRIHLRPRLDVEGAHFVAIPSHGLEGGVVITQLSFPAQEVLSLEDGQPCVTVVLQAQRTGSDCQAHSWKSSSLCCPPLRRPCLPDQSPLQCF